MCVRVGTGWRRWTDRLACSRCHETYSNPPTYVPVGENNKVLATNKLA